MTTLANTSRTLHATPPDAASLIGRWLTVSWTCTRRESDARCSRLLERVCCVVAVRPLDRQHATIECWIESEGVRQRTILRSTTRPCMIDMHAAHAHLDMPAADGSRLLALSFDLASAKILYAQCTLLCDAGFVGGTYDPPMLRAMAEERAAQSA